MRLPVQLGNRLYLVQEASSPVSVGLNIAVLHRAQGFASFLDD
jgi:hypothetical protein